MYLYLVRHGQSEGNVLRTFHGQTDYPLTEKGREVLRKEYERIQTQALDYERVLRRERYEKNKTANGNIVLL